MKFTGNKQEISHFLYKLDKDTIWDIKLEKHHNKRSLNANNYAWELITQISNVLRLSKEEIYFQMLKDYGQRAYVCIPAEVSPNRISDYYEENGTFIKNNRKFKSYMFYIGTSKYNSKEMSIFIDGVNEEARNLGIDTLEDKEIKEMLKELENGFK